MPTWLDALVRALQSGGGGAPLGARRNLDEQTLFERIPNQFRGGLTLEDLLAQRRRRSQGLWDRPDVPGMGF